MSNPSVNGTSSQRLMSIDALRGFDMFWIVGASSVVNALQSMKENRWTNLFVEQLTHVDWIGFHFYDLIFPLFLFIVGISIVFSLDKSMDKHGTAGALWRIGLRSCLLFAIGILYYGGLSKPWPEVHLGGVLHRIALCYFGASIIYVISRNRIVLGLVMAGLLIGYWAVMTFVSFPDLKLEKAEIDRIAKEIGSDRPRDIAKSVDKRIRGSFEEGRNLCNYLDFRFLPGKKAQRYYINEGLLSTFPAIGLCLGGILAGLLLKDDRISSYHKVGLLIAVGCLAIACGWLWSFQFPIIKRIWSSSFVLVAGGMSAILVGVFYFLIDVQRWRAWCQPFVWIGCNALTIYVFVRFVSFKSLAEHFVGGDIKAYLDTNIMQGAGSLLIALVSLGLVIGFARFLYRRNIFLRV